MAFSLEASLVVPLAFSTWLGLIMTAEPACQAVRQAALLEVQATRYGLANQHLYHSTLIQAGEKWVTAVQTSPQTIIELTSLISDDWQIISRQFADPGSGQGQGGGTGS